MIGLGSQYLTAAGFGRYRITAASLGNLDLLGSVGWLKGATKAAILGAFGDDGMAVINATNAYLNGIAASDRDKATALAGFINEDPMMVCNIGITPQLTTLPSMPWRTINSTGSQYFKLGIFTTATSKATYIALATAQSGTYMHFFGGQVAFSGDALSCLRHSSSNIWCSIGNGEIHTSRNLTLNTLFEVEATHEKFIMDGQVLNTSTVAGYTSTKEMYLLWCNRNGSGVDSKFAGNTAVFKLTNCTDGDHWYVPFMNNGTIELLDIEKSVETEQKVFATKVGTFTYSYGYMQNGQWVTWTPSTP